MQKIPLSLRALEAASKIHSINISKSFVFSINWCSTVYVRKINYPNSPKTQKIKYIFNFGREKPTWSSSADENFSFAPKKNPSNNSSQFKDKVCSKKMKIFSISVEFSHQINSLLASRVFGSLWRTNEFLIEMQLIATYCKLTIQYSWFMRNWKLTKRNHRFLFGNWGEFSIFSSSSVTITHICAENMKNGGAYIGSAA